jgi:hypothetical protein
MRSPARTAIHTSIHSSRSTELKKSASQCVYPIPYESTDKTPDLTRGHVFRNRRVARENGQQEEQCNYHQYNYRYDLHLSLSPPFPSFTSLHYRIRSPLFVIPFVLMCNKSYLIYRTHREFSGRYCFRRDWRIYRRRREAGRLCR